YRVAFYSGAGTYYLRYSGSNTFANGTINQSYEISGDGFPTASDFAHWWMVDLRYVTGSGALIPISPTNSGSFANGFWNGELTVLAQANTVVLRADDEYGHTGASTPLFIARGELAPPAITHQPLSRTNF